MVEETTFRKLKHALLELMKGYPEYVYYGKFESYLTKTGEKSVDLLIEHEIIEELPKKEVKKVARNEEEEKCRWYRLKPRGVDLAISMINLEHSEKIVESSNQMLKYTQTIKTLTWVIVGASVLTLGSIIFSIPFIQELIKFLF